jgi:hypothetical protein
VIAAIIHIKMTSIFKLTYKNSPYQTLLENMRLTTDLATDFHQNWLLIQLVTDLATNENQ